MVIEKRWEQTVLDPMRILVVDDETKTAKVLQPPPREQIDTPVDEQLIVEYYSR